MLVDAHSHLDRYNLVSEGALESALEEITQHRIFTISNSMDLPPYRRNRAIAELCDLVLPTFGVHPWNAPEYANRLEELSEAIKQSPMLGEIGLDHYFVKDASEYPDQRKVFEFFLVAAREQGKIINTPRGQKRQFWSCSIATKFYGQLCTGIQGLRMSSEN